MLHEPGNVSEMVAHMIRLKNDPSLRKTLGDNGRSRVLRDFSEKLITSAVLTFYGDALAERVGVSNS